MKKCKFILLLFVLFVGGNLFSQNSNRTRVYVIPAGKLEVPVTISGKLAIKQFYGPPNYGETPKIDKIESYYVLQLYEPITVQEGSSTATVNEIQLILYNNNSGLITGGNYVVEGEAFFAQTGHHHTPIMISVNRITKE